MTTIRQEDFIQSIAEAFQYISCYHAQDYILALHQAYLKEKSPAARNAMAQILVNSRLCAAGHRPICQDTGVGVVFLKVGMQVSWQADMSVQEMVDEGVRRAYLDPNNTLRASMLRDPAGERKNTGDNTPAVVHTEIVPGNTITVICAAKGGGSENKTRFAMLNPSDDLVAWVLQTVPTMGSGWCPPGILGIGIGGTPEKAMLLAKESLMSPIDIHLLRARRDEGKALSALEVLRLDLVDQVNQLGIGAQGLGGMTTVLDIKIADYPTHAACLPIAMIPNCAATRHIHFVLDGKGPAYFKPPSLEDWPVVQYDASSGRRIRLASLTREEVSSWKPGEVLLLNGKLLTGRDAAHKRLIEMMDRQEKLPVDLTNRFIYYVGPVDPVRDEVVGPAGPTTSSRMDKFTRRLLEAGLLGMVGKAERGQTAIDAIRDHGAVYLIAVGGAAYLVSKAIKASRVIAFDELKMEAIYEFDVVDMPVTVAVDSQGQSIHQIGPIAWRNKT